MTYWGTNTYLIEGPDGLTVLDPGPDDPAHVAALLAAGPVTRILLSHTHHDHLGAVAALRERTGAPVHAWHSPSVPVGPFEPVRDGDAVAGWTAVFTPGHAGDHVCFARDGVVFSADHVMGWSSSVVSPPDGNMAAYVQSLRRMLARDDRLYLPGPWAAGAAAGRAGAGAAHAPHDAGGRDPCRPRPGAGRLPRAHEAALFPGGADAAARRRAQRAGASAEAGGRGQGGAAPGWLVSGAAT